MLYTVFTLCIFLLGFALGSRYTIKNRATDKTISEDIKTSLTPNRSRIISPSKVINDKQLGQDLND